MAPSIRKELLRLLGTGDGLLAIVARVGLGAGDHQQRMRRDQLDARVRVVGHDLVDGGEHKPVLRVGVLTAGRAVVLVTTVERGGFRR